MTAPRLRVTVVAKSGRKYLLLRCRDSFTGQETTKSSGTTIRREAERAAALWEEQLRTQRTPDPDEIAWPDFVERYRTQHLCSLATGTELRSLQVFDVFKRICHPSRLSGVTSQMIGRYKSVRQSEVADSTLISELGHLRAAFRWARDVGLMREPPHFPRIRRQSSKHKPMKGRPISDAEFNMMLKVTPTVVGKDNAPAWRRYLRGLWLSGLRLSESIDLWWNRDDRLSVDLTHTRPMLRVIGSREKGRKDRFLPIAPEFGEFLLETPQKKRTGLVFDLPRERHRGDTKSSWRVSEIVSKIGRAAGVIVDSRGPKYASAHDLRRSFGTRWARLVMPQELMQLMRHESIETTMRYYVDLDAQETSERLWNIVTKQKTGDTSGDTGKRLPKKRQKTG